MACYIETDRTQPPFNKVPKCKFFFFFLTKVGSIISDCTCNITTTSTKHKMGVIFSQISGQAIASYFEIFSGRAALPFTMHVYVYFLVCLWPLTEWAHSYVEHPWPCTLHLSFRSARKSCLTVSSISKHDKCSH